MSGSYSAPVRCPQHDTELDGVRGTFVHYLVEHGVIGTLRRWFL